jgi:hypothetical protein
VGPEEGVSRGWDLLVSAIALLAVAVGVIMVELFDGVAAPGAAGFRPPRIRRRTRRSCRLPDPAIRRSPG